VREGERGEFYYAYEEEERNRLISRSASQNVDMGI